MAGLSVAQAQELSEAQARVARLEAVATSGDLPAAVAADLTALLRDYALTLEVIRAMASEERS